MKTPKTKKHRPTLLPYAAAGLAALALSLGSCSSSPTVLPPGPGSASSPEATVTSVSTTASTGTVASLGTTAPTGTVASETVRTTGTVSESTSDTNPVPPPETSGSSIGQTVPETTAASEKKTEMIRSYTEEEAIPFETVRQYSDAYYEGESILMREGVEGVLSVTTTVSYYGNEMVGKWVKTAVETEPVSAIVLIGTKDPESKEQIEIVTPIPYQTVIRDDPHASEGTSRVQTPGKNGARTDVYEVIYYKGREISRTYVESRITEPTSEVILRGIRHTETVAVDTVLPFETVTVEDATVEEGTSFVRTEGKNGKKTDFYEVVTCNGEEVSRTLVRTEVEEPTAKVIVQGTLPPAVTETKSFITEIRYETVSEEDGTLAKGTSYVRTEGQNGKQIDTYEIVTRAGAEISRTLLSSETVAPVSRVVVVGTYEAPKAETFRMPYLVLGESSGKYAGKNYGITQYFGNNGHGGMDIGVWYGDAVVAAMSGTVVMAYNNGAFDPATDKSMLWTYGTFVVIEHENGLRTYYAHMSKKFVSVGEHVTKGQVIGESGNTGRVSPAPTAAKPYAGTHLHFEVREYDSATRKYVKKDPLNYLP